MTYVYKMLDGQTVNLNELAKAMKAEGKFKGFTLAQAARMLKEQYDREAREAKNPVGDVLYF